MYSNQSSENDLLTEVTSYLQSISISDDTSQSDLRRQNAQLCSFEERLLIYKKEVTDRKVLSSIDSAIRKLHSKIEETMLALQMSALKLHPYQSTISGTRTDFTAVDEEQLGPPEIPYEDIIFDREKDLLGEGAFGKVYKGFCRGKVVAIKEPSKQELTMQEEEDFVKEVKIMRKIVHPNVVALYGAHTNPDPNKGQKILLVMEYCQTDLETLLKSDRENKAQIKHNQHLNVLSMRERILLAKDAALGLNWLHGINGIVHGDLKSANLLIDEKRVLKVSDFGFAVVKKPNDLRKESSPVGTPLYMPPEVMNCLGYDGFKADIYSFGIVLWEIITSQPPFSQFSEWNPFKNAVCSGCRPEIPVDCPKAVANLMKRCWNADANQRPNFPEILFRLEECLVEATITDSKGAEFWKEHFLYPTQQLKERVQWDEFKDILIKNAKEPEKKEVATKNSSTASSRQPQPQPRVPPLKELLEMSKDVLAFEYEDVLKRKSLVVTPEYFNKMIYTFGYFFLPETTHKVLVQIGHIINHAGFHGNIDRLVAESRLVSSFDKGKAPNGIWLIRLRDPTNPNSEPGCPFALSYTKNGGFIHRTIHYNPRSKLDFKILIDRSWRTFRTLGELVSCRELGLKRPCEMIDSSSSNNYAK